MSYRRGFETVGSTGNRHGMTVRSFDLQDEDSVKVMYWNEVSRKNFRKIQVSKDLQMA